MLQDLIMCSGICGKISHHRKALHPFFPISIISRNRMNPIYAYKHFYVRKCIFSRFINPFAIENRNLLLFYDKRSAETASSVHTPTPTNPVPAI